ncbi:MAG: KH domain-containing protein [bacterium]|nr:KH domain-containing protein [bacterium]
MKDLLEYIIKNIVDSPDEIKITETTQGEEEILNIKVASTDMGRVIGKNGQIIKSIRTLLRTKAFKEGKKIQVLLEELKEEIKK